MKSFRVSSPGTGIVVGANVICVEPPPRSRAAKLDASEPVENTSSKKLTVNQAKRPSSLGFIISTSGDSGLKPD